MICLPLSSLFAITTDGKIEKDEYPGIASFADGEYVLHWMIDGEIAHFAIDAKSNGWVAVGFDPEYIMDKADMVFGIVPEAGSGEVSVIDTFSDGAYGPHPEDEKSGGKSDILEFSGSRQEGRVIFEFSRKLDTGEMRDKVIKTAETFPIVWAVGDDSDFESMHSNAGSANLDLTKGTGSRRRDVLGWFLPLHIFLMSLSFAGMTIGALIARYYKKSKLWLKIHRPLGAISSLTGAVGVITAGIMVQISSGTHLRVPHAIAGLIVILLCLAMPVLGFAIFKSKVNKKEIKTIHRVLGRVTITSMALVILSGLLTAGILRF